MKCPICTSSLYRFAEARTILWASEFLIVNNEAFILKLASDVASRTRYCKPGREETVTARLPFESHEVVLPLR